MLLEPTQSEQSLMEHLVPANQGTEEHQLMFLRAIPTIFLRPIHLTIIITVFQTIPVSIQDTLHPMHGRSQTMCTGCLEYGILSVTIPEPVTPCWEILLPIQLPIPMLVICW